MLHYKKIFFLIIIGQFFIISYLLYILYTTYATPLVSITPIPKNTIDISPSTHLHYFFEPKKNTILTEIYYERVSLSKPAKYTINKDTLNERFNYSTKKEKNTFRIITLGDSFTYGHYIDTANNWTEVLEEKLQTCPSNTHFEVINLAVPNYDIQYSIERFKKRGLKYDPDLVIWFLKHDDFEQINEITLPIKKKYFDDMQKSGYFEKSIKNGEYWPHTIQAVKQLQATYTIQEILSKQLAILNSFNKYFTNTLVLVTPNNEYQSNKSVLQTFAQTRSKIYTYTSLPSFSVLPDLHPNITGHSQIAKNIFNYLVDKKVISCDDKL